MLPTPTTIASYDFKPAVNIEASAIVMSHVAVPSYASIGPCRGVRWKESLMRVRHSLAALSAIALVAMLAPQPPLQAQDAAKGGMLMAEARKALGGEDKLAAIKRLQASGTFLRSTGPDQIVDGDFDVFLELPDKYRRDEITGFAGANVERTEALNGTDVWDDSSGGLTGGRGFGGGGGFGRGGRGGGDRGGGGGGGFRGGGFEDRKSVG